YKLAAENIWVVDGVTDRRHQWIEGTAKLTVIDGRLTVSRLGNSGAINSIDIARVGDNSGPFFDGVTVTGSRPKDVIPTLRDLGAKGVRLWSEIHSWNERTMEYAYKAAQEYHAAGFTTTLLIQCRKVPTYKQAKAFFDWVQTIPGILKGVDRWEIGNEPDISKYYDGTLPQYVKQELKPAYYSLHANGELVVGAG